MTSAVAEPGLSGVTRVAAVIGHPVAHSLSPIIHNAAFAQADLDWTYVAFDVAPGHGADAVAAMRTLGLAGLSVTMPHKHAVADAVDRCSDAAARLGAVNTVAWDGTDLVGHSTDGEGLIDALRSSLGFDADGARVVVVGAGGAARAAVLALSDAGAAHIGVCNRTAVKAESAAALAGSVGSVATPDDLSSADLIVQATSVGMLGGGAPDETPFDPALLGPGQVVVDMVYHPEHTPLLRLAASAGSTVVGGVAMLVHQAARQFELWTSVPAPVEAMTAAATHALAARRG